MFERLEYEEEGDQVRSKHTLVENYSVLRRQYLRAREYCGYSLDEIINSRAAHRYLSEIWLLGCMVRKPQKAQQLPERIRIGNVMPVEPSMAATKKGKLEPRL